MFPEALVGGLHATPPPKERAGTRVAGQEYPASAQGAPRASSCSLPGALHELHPRPHSGKSAAPPRGHRPLPRWWTLSRDTVPSSATSTWSSLSPAVCPLIHEHRWRWHHLLSEGQTETSVEQTKTSLLIPTLIYFLLLEARLFYFREHQRSAFLLIVSLLILIRNFLCCFFSVLQSLLLPGVTHHLTGLLTEDPMYQSTTTKTHYHTVLVFHRGGRTCGKSFNNAITENAGEKYDRNQKAHLPTHFPTLLTHLRVKRKNPTFP